MTPEQAIQWFENQLGRGVPTKAGKVLQTELARLRTELDKRNRYVDEDGCCQTCGGDVVMWRDEVKRLRAVLKAKGIADD